MDKEVFYDETYSSSLGWRNIHGDYRLKPIRINTDPQSNSYELGDTMNRLPNVGDKIRRKGGVDPQTVTKVDLFRLLIWAEYDKSGQNYYPEGQRLEDIVIIEEGEKDMTNQLYEFEHEGNTHYGYHLATNSQGLWVMEVKSSGATVAVDKSIVKEVIPYTVDIVFFDSGVGESSRWSYTAKEGDWSVDDIIVIKPNSNTTFARVVAVDTKSKKATKDLAEEAIGKVTLDTTFKN